MVRPFVKMNGAGNDFVVVNALETPFAPTADQARAIADRCIAEDPDLSEPGLADAVTAVELRAAGEWLERS